MNINFHYQKKITLEEAIWDLKDTAIKAKDKNKTNGDLCEISNHEYMNGSFSTIYMSINRGRSCDEQSFTIQASSRHVPIHPQAPKMLFVEKIKEYSYQARKNFIDVFQAENVQEYKHSLIILNFITKILLMVINWLGMQSLLCLHTKLQIV